LVMLIVEIRLFEEASPMVRQTMLRNNITN
jgi:hypothetical protein